MSNNRFISWRRVSTKKQGRSGLGLEAQADIIRYFVEREDGELIADYAEVYTGKDLAGCTELRKAIDHAKQEDAILIIAKTDRFRNTIEALQVYEEMGDGHIMFCDLPHTDKFTLTLFFALAEREALLVSIRTRQALAVKKAQGCKLGASSEKYAAGRASKSKEQLIEEAQRRGAGKRAHFLDSADVQAFFKILRLVFTDVAIGEPVNWDWKRINTRADNREKVLALMQSYREMNSGLFARWDFTDTTNLQLKLANWLLTIRRSLGVKY